MPLKAMILAAGVGSRLRPLTDTCPKALIEVNGTPVLEIILRRLIRAGVGEVIINVFHLAEQIIHFLETRNNFGIHIEISRETELLDTGGGLKKAAPFFSDGHPFILHNGDVLATLDLRTMLSHHNDYNNLATLYCGGRESIRCFLFDDNDRLCGWRSMPDGRTLWARGPISGARPLPFNGIHILSPSIFPQITEEGVFSINRTYLRLAGEGKSIQAFEAPGVFWRDIGRVEQLETIRREIMEKGIVF
jgi:NDP-sugar pyrophosphorylase family protein